MPQGELAEAVASFIKFHRLPRDTKVILDRPDMKAVRSNKRIAWKKWRELDGDDRLSDLRDQFEDRVDLDFSGVNVIIDVPGFGDHGGNKLKHLRAETEPYFDPELLRLTKAMETAIRHTAEWEDDDDALTSALLALQEIYGATQVQQAWANRKRQQNRRR